PARISASGRSKYLRCARAGVNSELGPGRCGASRTLVHPVDHLLQYLVWLRAHDEVAPAEDVRRYGVDADGSRRAPVLVDHVVVAILQAGLAQLLGVQADLGPYAHEVVDVLQPAGAFPVGLQQRAMHLVELALLARELCRAKGTTRVDDHVALLHREPDGFGDCLQV